MKFKYIFTDPKKFKLTLGISYSMLDSQDIATMLHKNSKKMYSRKLFFYTIFQSHHFSLIDHCLLKLGKSIDYSLEYVHNSFNVQLLKRLQSEMPL